MRRRAALAAALALACAVGITIRRTAAQETDAIPRYLFNLRLGDRLADIREVYPPLRDWSILKEPNGGVVRIELKRSYARYFPENVDILRLTLRRGRLVWIQGVFSAANTRRRPLEDRVVELSTLYGEPRRKDMTYFWQDRRTILRASNAEVPSADHKGVELRASLEVLDHDAISAGNLIK